MELVSIRMPAYNCDRFIAQTIRSVLAQTYTNWELLIVDDCSTDHTADVIASFDDHCAKGIRPLPKMSENVQRSLMLVTALSPAIGYEKEGVFYPTRTVTKPKLPLKLPLSEGVAKPVVQLVNAYGDQAFFTVN